MPAPPTYLLAIDTAAARLQLALFDGDGEIETSVDEIATGHAELIFGRIASLLDRVGAGYDALERVVVTTGPGSFTGLRIGISAARGIGLARRIPVIGVPSLIAVSLSAPGGMPVDVPVDVLLDARRGEAYFQSFAAPGVPIGPPDLLPVEVARATLRAGATLIDSPFVDIGRVARHGATLDPARHRPDPTYIRQADAKPQGDKRLRRQ